MPGRNRLSLLAAAAAALALASCGGDDETTTATGGQDAPAQERSAGAGSPSGYGDSGAEGGPSGQGDAGDAASGNDFTPKPHDDSGGGSEQFQVKGGDNSVQEFGAEAGGSEFDKAAAALHNFLDARAEQEWAAACEYLGSGLAASLEEAASQAAKGSATSCAVGLENMTNPNAAEELRREAAQVDVGSVRTEDESGFVLYRVGETIYAIPIAVEDGAFKVAALAGLPLN